MSLFDAISTARSGLIATQSAIDVASRNIANASVDGYTRKIQQQSARVVDGRAGAVKVEEVTRNVNEQLQRDVREQSSVVEELTVVEDFLRTTARWRRR
jgi:flagellar hook-associated protein 1 FlgK